MSTESFEPQDVTGGSPSEREALYSQTEFIWQVLKETANGLMKTIAFYFAMSAATLAYVLSNPLAASLRVPALWIIISIKLLFTVAFCVCELVVLGRHEGFNVCTREVITSHVQSAKTAPIFCPRPGCFLYHDNDPHIELGDSIGRNLPLVTGIVSGELRPLRSRFQSRKP